MNGNSHYNILVVRTDAIGDLLLAEPVAQVLKLCVPDCSVTYMVSKYAAPLLFGNPNIDRIIRFSSEDFSFNYSNIKKAVGILRMSKFDIAIILRPTLFNALAVAGAGIPIRIGTGYRLYSFLFNKKVLEHRKVNLKSEMEYNLSMLKAINMNFEISAQDFKPKVYIEGADLQRASKKLAEMEMKDDEVAVLIHPGGRGSAPKWPLSRYIQLMEKLIQLPGVKPILTGKDDDFNNSQRAQTTAFTEKLNGRVINLIGWGDLRDFMALISLSRLVVTNSTGSAHLAAAAGTPLVAIYPDSQNYSLKRWAPVANPENISVIAGPDVSAIGIEKVLGECMHYLLNESHGL